MSAADAPPAPTRADRIVAAITKAIVAAQRGAGEHARVPFCRRPGRVSARYELICIGRRRLRGRRSASQRHQSARAAPPAPQEGVPLLL